MPRELSLPEILDDLERQLILKAYAKASRVKTETARLLGIKTSRAVLQAREVRHRVGHGPATVSCEASGAVHRCVAVGPGLSLHHARSPRLEDWSYAALRIVAGLAFSLHGFQKIFGVLTTKAPPELWSQRWVGGVIELVGGVLIALGLFTRPAAFLASGTMAVAYIQFHWKFQLGAKFFPISGAGNGGELALLYCFLFLWFCLRGGGAGSLDRLRGRG